MKPRLIALIAIGLALGGYGYVRFTRFDRIATRAATEHVSSQEWDLIKDKPEDPRVMAAAILELDAAASQSGCDGIQAVPAGARAVLDTHPTTDDDSLAAIVKLIEQCPDARTTAWTARPQEDLVHALHADLKNAADRPKDILADALVKLAPKTTQELVDVVVATVKADPSNADALVTTGLPEAGEKLADATANILRQAPHSDPRVTNAIRTWLSSMKEEGVTDAAALAITRVLPWAQAPSVDDAMADAIAKSIDKLPSVEKLCSALVLLPADAAMLSRHGTGPKVQACARTATDMKPALDMLEGAAVSATDFEDDPKNPETVTKRNAWEDAQAEQVVKLGPPALGAAREALKSNARTTRRIAARTFAKLDQAAYAATIADLLRARSANPDDAKLALELLPKQSAVAVQPALAAYFTADADTIKKANAALKTTEASLWVPPLFASITVAVANQAAVVNGYLKVLEDTNGTASFAARALDAAITRAGRPDATFWLTKVLALRAIKAHGNSGDARLVERFTKDKSQYPQYKVRTEQFSGEVVEESRETKTIGDLATATLGLVKSRQAFQP